MFPEHFLDRHELRLDLDHEENSFARPPSENIDRTTLAVDAVGNLDSAVPAVLREQLDDEAHQTSVAFVHEPVEVAAAPAEQGLKLRVKLSGNTPDRGERDELEAAPFDERDDVLRNAGAPRQVLLAPAEAVPKCPKASTDPDVLHGSMLTAEPYSAITESRHDSYPRRCDQIFRIWARRAESALFETPRNWLSGIAAHRLDSSRVRSS